MPQREFDITIAPDGSVEIHVKGYRGKSCLEAMKIFEQVVGEKSTAFLRTQMLDIAKIETPDDKTVRFVMKEPAATLPLVFASFHMPIISRVSDSKITA